MVQNRFRVKQGREAAFEKRWADRESRLGTLPGFRFFCMLRRVDRENTLLEETENDPNYISCTVWEKYENFESWRKGDAFKEAHGGGTVKGVLSMLAATARNTKGGKPKPAYWQGLLPETVAGTPPDDSKGWRRLVADGTSTLPTECFVAMNRFSVLPNMEAAFETKFAQRESVLKACTGFRGFLLLRRDGKKQPGDGGAPDDGHTHSTFSVWDEKANFDAWMASNANKEKNNKKPPLSGGPPPSQGGSPAVVVGGEGPPKIYSKPPTPSFYQGFLLVESKDGV